MSEDQKTASIGKAIECARKNWNDWRDVFEHGAPIHTSPLLTVQTRFASFCKEYSVSRTIRRGTQDEFRRTLLGPDFSAVIDDDNGHALDDFEMRFRSSFGTRNGKNGIVSVLSKVASLLRPERFVAWDSYARKGVKVALGPKLSLITYADYLAAFDQAWNGAPGQDIRDYLANNDPPESPIHTEPRFLRRVLDRQLMEAGGFRT
jgi:hypothetical protein